MKNDMTCLRCQHKMNHIRKEKLQLGQTGWLLGDLPNLLAGAIEVDIYACPHCGKLEFFSADTRDADIPQKEDRPQSTCSGEAPSWDADIPQKDGMPQKQCPNCGKWHDFDYPRCPLCKYDYTGRR